MPEASTVRIASASEEEVRDIALWRRMREHNYRIVGKYPEGQNVWLNAKDPQGNFLGGFRGEIHFHWLFVNILFVEEAHRNKGIGSRLLGEGEAHARKLGASRARLDTFDWQAPAFYLKHGYRELVRMPDYYRGHASSLMVKDL
ncbi:MAG TPA: GNAT family N-acetyltransferase [Burkholderiales bacterium]|jgi:GNAT superfamily N-acetyltransferase|nr:GNAT family N-acetyltransferase [Burkholderiales bacterium]